MHPILVDLRHVAGWLYLPSYGVLFAAGVLAAWWWFARRAGSLGLPEDRVFNLAFYTLLGGIVGAKLLLVVVERDLPSSLAELIGLLRSAGVLVGGVLGGAVAFVVVAHRTGLPIRPLGDAIAAPLALAQAIGRLGCLAAGCCYGTETSAGNPLAIVFHDPDAREQTGVPLGVPLVATQPIQMVHDLLLAGLLTWLWRRRPSPAGTVFWVYVLLYSVGRGVIEIWRGDERRGMFFDGALSTSQLFAIAGALFAVAMLWYDRRRAA